MTVPEFAAARIGFCVIATRRCSRRSSGRWPSGSGRVISMTSCTCIGMRVSGRTGQAYFTRLKKSVHLRASKCRRWRPLKVARSGRSSKPSGPICWLINCPPCRRSHSSGANCLLCLSGCMALSRKWDANLFLPTGVMSWMNPGRGGFPSRPTFNCLSATTLHLDETPAEHRSRANRARLIHKVYEVDPLDCPNCGHTMRIIAVAEVFFDPFFRVVDASPEAEHAMPSSEWTHAGTCCSWSTWNSRMSGSELSRHERRRAANDNFMKIEKLKKAFRSGPPHDGGRASDARRCD